MKLRFFSLLIILFLFDQSSAQNGWCWQYPKPQGNTLWDVFVLDKNTTVAVGDLGTIIKTSNGGATWETKHHISGVFQDLLDVYFLDKFKGWAVGGIEQRGILCKGILLVTEDGGEHWSVLATDSIYSFSCVYFTNPDTGWVFGSKGLVMKTIDGGNSWSKSFIYTLDDYPTFGAVDFIDDQTGWAVANGFYGNSIYKTTDGGNTWSQLSNVHPVVNGSTGVQFVDRSNGWVVGLAGGIIRTTDGGASWTHQRQSETDGLYSVHFVNADTGWVAGTTIGGSPSGGLILTTTDGGNTWREQANVVSGRLFSIDFAGGVGWAVGWEGVMFKTTDSGENWIPQREDKSQFSSIFFVSVTTGWAVGSRGVILHTTDGGANWYKQNQNDSLSLSSIYAMDAQNALAVGAVIKGAWPAYSENGVSLRTTDSGQTWLRTTHDTLSKFSSVLFVDDSTGWIAVTNGTLLKTTNSGGTWQQFCSGLGSVLYSMQFINESTGWVSFYRGNTLMKTVDDGKNWKRQFINTNFSMNSFCFINANVGWAVGDYNGGNNIFKTTDGGENWAPCGSPPIAHYYSVHFVNERTGWAVGEYYLNQKSSSIIKTTDGGNTWIDQNGPLKTGLTNIFFLNESTGWVVGDGIIKTTSGGGVVSVDDQEEPENNPPKQMILFQNYPNPFNPKTQIQYGLSSVSQVSIRIYDILGREVAVLVNNEIKGIGWHNVEWDSRDKQGHLVPSGTYICRLVADERVQTLKIVLMK